MGLQAVIIPVSSARSLFLTKSRIVDAPLLLNVDVL